jgi:hypothetical protein
VPIYTDTTPDDSGIPYGLRLKHGISLGDGCSLRDAAARLLELRRSLIRSGATRPSDAPARDAVKILEKLVSATGRAPAQRSSSPAHELVVEKITDFEAQKDRIHDAIALYEERIPRDERYDHEMMVDLVRRHLSTEFGQTWTLHFLVATYGGRCVGMLICYEDIGRNFAFIAYLATRNPRTPGKNPPDVSRKLAESLMEERRRLGLGNPSRFLFGVDDPALTEDRKSLWRWLDRDLELHYGFR